MVTSLRIIDLIFNHQAFFVKAHRHEKKQNKMKFECAHVKEYNQDEYNCSNKNRRGAGK